MLGENSWIGDTLQPETCFLHTFNMEEMRSALLGKWVFMSGGSNTLLAAIVWGNVIEAVHPFSPH